MKLFIGKLPYRLSEEELRGLFEEFGALKSCKIVIDRELNRSKGFGFVEFESKESGEAAIKEMDGKEVMGREIVVNEARPQERRPA
jgi:cold-inducible RNA-binding protein